MLGHTARMAFVVWSTPHQDATDEFERWYNEVHLPDAIENGSFVAMHRYEAVGPGYRAAPYLSIAEADYGSEAEAWATVRQRAQSLRDAGRIDDLYRVDFATMLLTVASDVSDIRWRRSPPSRTTGAIPTVTRASGWNLCPSRRESPAPCNS